MKDRIPVFVNLGICVGKLLYFKVKACWYHRRRKLDKLFSFVDRHRVEAAVEKKHLEIKVVSTRGRCRRRHR